MKSRVDHRARAGMLWPVLVSAAENNKTLTYGEAAESIRVHHRPLRYALSPIQDYCIEEGLPALTALVVNSHTGSQGGGFLGGRIADVFGFNWKLIENQFSTTHFDKINDWASRILAKPSSYKIVYNLVPSRGDAQRVFRNTLLRAYSNRCAVCETSFTEILEAAHIISWSISDPAQRINPKNGILLCANRHRLFDNEYLIINKDYSIEYYDMASAIGFSKSDHDLSAVFNGRYISTPNDPRLRPDPDLLEQRISGS